MTQVSAKKIIVLELNLTHRSLNMLSKISETFSCLELYLLHFSKRKCNQMCEKQCASFVIQWECNSLQSKPQNMSSTFFKKVY